MSECCHCHPLPDLHFLFDHFGLQAPLILLTFDLRKRRAHHNGADGRSEQVSITLTCLVASLLQVRRGVELPGGRRRGRDWKLRARRGPARIADDVTDDITFIPVFK